MNMRSAPDDEAQAEAECRQLLMAAGGHGLPCPPWRHPGQAPEVVDLVRLAAWRGARSAGDEGELRAALGLLAAARAEVDQLEAAIFFLARAQGLTWAQVASAVGLGSAQAAAQRFDRLHERTAGA